MLLLLLSLLQKDKYSMKELSLEACPEAEYLRHAPPLPADGTKCPREKFRVGRWGQASKQLAA